jgi:hypothetical protein
VDNTLYQEVSAVVADWSAFWSLDGDSNCDYFVR